jgi:hypothetical protein
MTYDQLVDLAHDPGVLALLGVVTFSLTIGAFIIWDWVHGR